MPLHCYSEVPALRLDIRPYTGGDIRLDIPLHITDSHSEETPPPVHNNCTTRYELGLWEVF